MSKTKILIAVALINIVVIAGIVNELGFGNEEVDTSTIVTAKLTISYSNAGDNDTLTFESITTTEIYTHLNKEYLREVVNKFHPRS